MEQNEVFGNSQVLSLIFTIQMYCSWSYEIQSKSKNIFGKTSIKIDNWEGIVFYVCHWIQVPLFGGGTHCLSQC